MTDTLTRVDAAQNLKIEPVGIHIGAAVTGIDVSQPLDDATIAALTRAHAEHLLLIFPDQDISAEGLMAFGRNFGELTVHPFSPHDEEHHELIKFRNDETSAPFYTDVWHTDETFRTEPPMGTMLCARTVPEVGGDTVFCSMVAAYEGLSDRMQQFISGLEAVHDLKPFREVFGRDRKSIEMLRTFEDRFPPAIHPVVREHPVTGKRALFVNPQFTIRIKDMAEEESRNLLDQLFRQAWIPEYQYRHKHRPGTVIFWDNRGAQHYAVHDYYPAKRYMDRVTIKGDRPFGPHGADAKSIRSRKSAFVDMREEGNTGGHVPHE